MAVPNCEELLRRFDTLLDKSVSRAGRPRGDKVKA
jgi:hypothetical protein